MVASIGAVASPSQGASYYERDGYYAKDSPEHLAASAWAGKGAAELDLRGPVDPDTFKAVLEGEVPDGSGKRLGRRMGHGEIRHRPGRDLTFSAPKSVSLAALVGGDLRIVAAHDRAVGRALGWFERNAAETRTQDPASGRMVRTGDQKTVIATFRHETSRNLDPALHTHSVIANMLHGPDGKWRTMANESLYASKMLLGALYRSELAGELAKLGYGIERTHADGRFEIAGVSRDIIDAFSTRRAEIEAAMADRGLGATAENQHLARRAALMTRAAKRDVDRAELREIWEKQASHLGFEAKALVAEAMERGPAGPAKAGGRAKDAGKGDESRGVRQADLFEHAARAGLGREAVDWALAHLSERDAVFARTDLLAAALAYSPGAASIGEIERAVNDLQREGRLHDAPAFPGSGPGQAGSGGLTTERAVADERETIALMRSGAGRGKAPMKDWTVDRHLRKGPLTAGQKQAVKLILSEKDRTVGVQGFAGTGKTRMLNRARALAEKKGWRMVGLAPSASAVQTLTAESGIRSETLQRFLARNAGVAEGRLTKKGVKAMRAAFTKTVLVVDEGSLASTVQARDLLRIAGELRIPKLVLVGDSKQLDAVDAGKPFAQLQQAGMKTAVMDEILRQRDPDLKAAVEASLAGEIGRAFDKLGANVAEVKADNIAGAVAARWLKLFAEERERTGVMAPSHELREGINAHIRERLVREGRIAGPALETQRLVSKGYTNAEKALASNYTPGDVVAFHRPYKRLGVEKGDERRVERVDRAKRLVHLEGRDGKTVAWKPSEIGGRQGGTEVYRAETVELRAGDRIRWTRNDTGLGVVNSGTAEVLRIHNGRVTFALEDGRRLTLTPGDPQLRHLDHAWASTVHAFQGRTVDNVIA
ncbi:MAG: relaxase domain-containing protein, partial [Rhodospirillaceae bacterium]|nr:relaxase domain-containing protein [Rhodospirillaceae bacterium]